MDGYIREREGLIQHYSNLLTRTDIDFSDIERKIFILEKHIVEEDLKGIRHKKIAHSSRKTEYRSTRDSRSNYEVPNEVSKSHKMIEAGGGAMRHSNSGRKQKLRKTQKKRALRKHKTRKISRKN
jgi:hypothetical protein